MSITVNPGTGAVPGGTREQARTNMGVFAADVAAEHGYDLASATIDDLPVAPETFRVPPLEIELPGGGTYVTEAREYTIDPESEGRFTFTLTFGDLAFEVEMPGIPVERVRYTGAEDQNILAYPRLYVDGSSWVWTYAVSACRARVDDE